MALAELPAGAAGAVRRLEGGRRLASRLAALGLTPGTKLMVVRNDRGGPLIVMARGARIAIGRGEAAKVFVEVAADGPDPGLAG